MTILELNNLLPLITPKGKAIAHFLIDYGIETNLYWVCFLQSNGECWTFDNKNIKIESNITLGRILPENIAKT